MAAPKKPLLFPTSETDSVRVVMEQPFLYEERDSTYIPGYTEEQMAADVKNGKLSREEKEKLYEQIGKEPIDSPVSFKWVRTTAPGGGPSHRADIDASEFLRQGYRRVTVAEFDKMAAQYGYGRPPAARIAEDGSICREDTQLWVSNGDQARAILAYQHAKAAEAENPRPVAGRESAVKIGVVEEKRRQVALNTPTPDL